MDDLMAKMENCRMDNSFHIIEEDLKHLANIYYNGSLDALDFPILEEDYPYDLLFQHDLMFQSLKKEMRNISGYVHDNDVDTLLHIYLELVTQ